MDSGIITTQESDSDSAVVIKSQKAGKESPESPPLPGAILRHQYLKRTRTTLTAFAAHIGVSRRTVSMLVNGSRPVSVDVANRLARALGTTPQFWLNLQHEVDIRQALRDHGAEYDQIEPLAKKPS